MKKQFFVVLSLSLLLAGCNGGGQKGISTSQNSNTITSASSEASSLVSSSSDTSVPSSSSISSSSSSSSSSVPLDPGDSSILIDGAIEEYDYLFLRVRNEVASINFASYVHVHENARYSVYNDMALQDEVVTKVALLNEGQDSSNIFYIRVVNSKASTDETYKLVIHRNYLYTVSFDTNGGDPLSSTYVEEGYLLENPPLPTKAGYHFDSWSVDFTKPINDNVTAVAYWLANIYTITLDAKGGEVSQSEVEVTFSESFVLPDASKLGYNFSGWYYGSEKVTDFTYKYPYDVTFVAHYETIEYNITYDLNGGDYAGNATKYTIESQISLNPSSKSGYNFIGWADEDGNVINEISKGTYGDLHLTAQFDDGKFYTLTLDPLDGTYDGDLTIQVQYNHEYSIKRPIKPGYSASWVDENGNSFALSGIWKATRDYSLTAKYVALHYTMTFHNVENCQTTFNNPTYFTIETGLVLPTPIKHGYDFLGWYIDEELKTLASDIPAGEVPSSSYLDVYAKFSDPLFYRVNFDCAGGDEIEPMEVQYLAHYVLPTPTRLGYDFTGWKLNGKSFPSEDYFVKFEDITLTATWSAHLYKITYDLGVFSFNNDQNPTSYTVEDEFEVYPPTTKYGYIFTGWYNENDELVSSIARGTTGNLVLSAHHEVEIRTITFDYQGFFDNESYEYEFGTIFYLPKPYKDGFIFDYWTCGSLNSDMHYAGGTDVDVYSSITYYAHWKVIIYKFHFDFAGATFIPYNNKEVQFAHEPRGSTIMTLNAPAKDGYRFIGYEDQYGVLYEYNEDKYEVKIDVTNIFEDLYLTAKYTPRNYTITFDSNGGSEVAPMEATYLQHYKLPTPEKLGYTFRTWYFVTTGQAIDQEGTYTYTKNIDLKASWDLVEYKITYDFDGGTVNKPALLKTKYTIADGEFSLAPFTCTKEGYDFIGWFDENDNEITYLAGGQVGDILVRAKYAAKSYQLSVKASQAVYGLVDVTVNGSYKCGEEITAKIKSVLTNGAFVGWTIGGELVSQAEEYTFLMPAKDLSISAIFCHTSNYQITLNSYTGGDLYSYTSNKKYKYGQYPQTVLDNPLIENELNKISEPNEHGYYEYAGIEYEKLVASPYGDDYQFSNGKIVEAGKAYYFRVSSILWNVSSYDDNGWNVSTDLVLDNQMYNTNYEGVNEDGYYANAYITSSLREWLTTDFANKAFYKNDSKVETSVVDDGHDSETGVDYIVNEVTNDKFFIEKYESIVLHVKASDYAIAKGVRLYKQNLEYSEVYSIWTRTSLASYNKIRYRGEAETTSDYYVDQYKGVRISARFMK